MAAQQEHEPAAAVSAKPKGTLNVARWGEILQAAGEVFDEKGYQAARIEDIAARVGILKGSLYYYIESKEDLLFALSENAHTTGLTAIVEDAEMVAADAPTRLGAFILRWMVVLAANPPYATVTDREVGALSGERYQQVMAKRNELHGFVRGLIEQGIADGDFDPATDPGVATNSLFQMFNATSGWFRPSGRLTIPDIAEWYRRFVLQGLAASPAT